MLTPSAAVLAQRHVERRCAVCGGAACVFCPGVEAQWALVITIQEDGSTRRRHRLIMPAQPEISLCLADSLRWPRPRDTAMPTLLVSV
jgi:hypothetical protein